LATENRKDFFSFGFAALGTFYLVWSIVTLAYWL